MRWVSNKQTSRDEPPDLVQAVANEIMEYLKQHESAGDTAEGIRRWWIPGRGAEVPTMVVEAALDGLVKAGRAGVRVLATGERFYFGLGPRPKDRG